jgi:hypothetical protein
MGVSPAEMHSSFDGSPLKLVISEIWSPLRTQDTEASYFTTGAAVGMRPSFFFCSTSRRASVA